MHSLFRRSATRFTGQLSFPPLTYLQRTFKGQVEDVKAYYRRYPKRVDSDNLLGNLLLHIPLRPDMDDQRYVRFVEDVSEGVSRAFGVTSPMYRGRVHEGGVTLGPKTNEVIISVQTPFPVDTMDTSWHQLSALRYFYHTRVDLGLPIQNNSTPGKGSGVCSINIPLLALQYRYWLKYQSERFDQKESVYRFIGGFVLPNAIESFHDIAVFNRLSRLNNAVGIPKHPMAHPFYLTDLSGRVEAFCRWTIETNERRVGDIEQFVATTPMLIQASLFDTLQLPRDPVSRANDWALQLARLPYIRYIAEVAIKLDRGDRTYMNQLYLTLVEANQDSIFNGVGSPEIVKQYRSQVRQLIAILESKRQGWV